MPSRAAQVPHPNMALNQLAVESHRGAPEVSVRYFNHGGVARHPPYVIQDYGPRFLAATAGLQRK